MPFLWLLPQIKTSPSLRQSWWSDILTPKVLNQDLSSLDFSDAAKIFHPTRFFAARPKKIKTCPGSFFSQSMHLSDERLSSSFSISTVLMFEILYQLWPVRQLKCSEHHSKIQSLEEFNLLVGWFTFILSSFCFSTRLDTFLFLRAHFFRWRTFCFCFLYHAKNDILNKVSRSNWHIVNVIMTRMQNILNVAKWSSFDKIETFVFYISHTPLERFFGNTCISLNTENSKLWQAIHKNL